MSSVLYCGHCHNTAPYSTELGLNVDRPQGSFHYTVVRCHTCDELSVYGSYPEQRAGASSLTAGSLRLYPPSKELHEKIVPEPIRKTYKEATLIRRQAPNAFAGQIRRALEYLCKHQEAPGKTLYEKLAHLAEQGTLPSTLEEMSTLLRILGNIGVHAGDIDIEDWQAELIDEFFRWIIEYVYIAPSKIESMKGILAKHEQDETEDKKVS